MLKNHGRRHLLLLGSVLSLSLAATVNGADPSKPAPTVNPKVLVKKPAESLNAAAPAAPAAVVNVTSCGETKCRKVGGNLGERDFCPYCAPASVALGPMPGTGKVNVPVTIGITPHGFTGYNAADIPWPDASPAHLTIDFGNGDTRTNVPFQNDVGQTFITTYASPGEYYVRAGAEMGRFLKPNDWWVVYVCCAQNTSKIVISD